MTAIRANRRWTIGGALLAGAIGAVMMAGESFAQAKVSCPTEPTVSVTGSSAPADVCIPADLPLNQNPIKYFDDYSWKAFVAMVWPAKSDQRGVADATKDVNGAGPRVFETYKAEWELFRAGGAAPKGWDEVDDRPTPCGPGPLPAGTLVMEPFTKFGTLGQAGFGDLVHALPARNGTWVRFLTGFDRLEYEQIVDNKLYLREHLDKATPAQRTFKGGAIDVKSSWIDMTNVAHPERYHTREALVRAPGQPEAPCEKKLLGLVGLHIVQKTPSRPQWIWSTFEHVDNVPPDTGTAPSPMAFNDGTGTAMPNADPNGTFPPKDWANPQLYNVSRLQKIHSSTVETNKNYQKAISGKWQFYQLVMTQWPLQLTPKPIPPSQSGAPGFTFPGTGATTPFSNTTLETWDQKSISRGCMACHNLTQTETDFLWVLSARAFSPPSAVAPKQNPALTRLRALLEGKSK